MLSKADLLAADDIVKAKEYIAQQIRSNLRLELAVHAVSVQPAFIDLLNDRWFNDELAPLYEWHQQLTKESLHDGKSERCRMRSRESSKARVDRATHEKVGTSQSRPEVAQAETQLRRVSGRFEEIREQWFRHTLELREYTPAFLHEAAARVVETWRRSDTAAAVTWESLSDLATTVAAERASAIRLLMEDLARDLSRVIREVSDLFGDDSASAEEELQLGREGDAAD